jgi:hypothetical protein
MESGQHPQQQQQDSIVGGGSITSLSHQLLSHQQQQPLPQHIQQSLIGGVITHTVENGETTTNRTMMNGTGGLTVNTVQQRDYYPSPPSTETESSGSVVQLPQQRIIRGHIDIQGGLIASPGQPKTENTGRYPEYKH